MGPKWATGTHNSNYFPVFGIYGNIAKNSVDRIVIEYNILQFNKCQW